MIKNFLKSLLLLGILLVSHGAFASMDREARLAELEYRMSLIGAQNTEGEFGAVAASARPDVEGVHWFIILDALFWKTKIGGTEYAYTDQDPTATLPVKGKTKHMEFNWDWGLRAGLGYNFEYDQWDLRGVFTWWDTCGSDTVSAGLNSTVVPTRGTSRITDNPNVASLIPEGLFLFCRRAKSQFDFSYQAIDLELGRDFYVSSTLSLRPFWGVKTAWMDLEQITRYSGGSEVTSQTGNLVILGVGRNTIHVKESSDFWGLGPRTGVDSRWYLGSGFSLFGNLSLAALFGFFEVNHKEKYSAVEANRIRLHANRHAFSPTVQYQIGMRYDTYVHFHQHHISLGAAFEGQYWWRQNQMLKIDDAATLKYQRYSEDLSMFGLTLDLKWDF